MGIGEFLKSLLGGNVAIPVNHFDVIIEKAYQEIADRQYWYNLKATEIKIFNEKVINFADKEKVAFILQMMKRISDWYEAPNRYAHGDSKRADIRKVFIEQLFRSKLELEDADIESLIDAFIRYKGSSYKNIFGWPVKNFVAIVQKKYNGIDIPLNVKNALINLQVALEGKKNEYFKKDAIKLSEQIDTILFVPGRNDQIVKPVFFLGEDDFAVYANKMIATLPEAQKPIWYRLIAFCQKAGSSKPSKKFLGDGLVVVNDLGAEHFCDVLINWFSFIVRLKEKIEQQRYGATYSFITDVNSECLKGFIWLCSNFKNTELLQSLADLADRAYRKIPGVGQTSTVIGNACIFALYKSNSLEGVSHLSRLKLRAKQTSTQALIQKYILASAEERGVSAVEIEDIAVDDFDLSDSQISFELEGYSAVVKVEKVGKVMLNWYRGDGTAQKTDPSIVKEKQGEQLKKIKDTAKQIEAALSTQRDRLDFSFRTERKMGWEHFTTYYLNHGLVSLIAQKLIWRFENDGHVIDALRIGDRWVNNFDETVVPDITSNISLWHPATDTLENVRQWRGFLIKKEIQQPLKQAFREIYLLTDAEINTRTYSNRMAGHILKQHQFNSLAKGRNWKYALQGAFDGGSDGTAQIQLPEHKLIAEYWTSSIGGENDMTDAGIFSYVSTDQVRFKNLQTNQTVDLADIPVMVFSEVMRDVDLFVGVASVGNDPNWRDNGGMPAYRDYWQGYAFGELNEVSKNRKEILERLLPRLKISKVAEIKDRFLVVRGKKRIYKIHMGSTNILMEPNDQYLCIVPDRTQKNFTENVFLPFEGDAGLSVIISKAFLLADDDKITDVTITRQIDR